ncbi:MAG: ABC transporter permease [Gammaproteobacteria bacterium]|nr:ABC transporter permease [Gammaproteobacteria bacterium]
MMTTELMMTGVLQGLVLVLVTYGVMVPFRILHFPDLTAEGAYPLGGAICTSMLLMHVNPYIALLLAAMGAGLMGMGTALLHLRLKVNTLLAGIILSTMVYSVNLRILGQPNVALFNEVTLFVGASVLTKITVLSGLVAVLVLTLTWFLKTDYGLRLRAVGFNPLFAARTGIAVQSYTVFGLFIAGCFMGLGGGLMVQMQSYMDVGMGVGIVIHALAALMIGESVVGHHTLKQQLMAPLVGALLYQQIQGLALSLGLAPSDLKFFTGALVIAVIGMRRQEQRVA